MTDNTWQPTASLAALRQRAALLADIRQFFARRQVLEVEVPILSRRATSDPHIDSITALCNGDPAYLATSPEFGLKRLLAAGLGDCYYLGKAFREGEAGGRHNPEFTMLEWYRCGWDDRKLMGEVGELLSLVLDIQMVQSLSYRELFLRELQLDPHTASEADLRACVAREIELSFAPSDRDECLDLLMSHRLEPAMGRGITLLYDFPASQAALAKVAEDATGTPVARRFEAYVNGLELANGYWELTDPAEQLRRFQADHRYRGAHKLHVYPFEERLVEALQSGMPECAGVALGVDRLLMLAGGYSSIDQVIAFPIERA
ncbi:EF-P lysine aminoacylase EpmA [Microbulbifer thermotolerans]|uniref:EF-P lysine aminoacylase EpmA n=1 Tax=Microbulbifer thermotolerans TaxID=252514 RepID=UPI00224A6308|nr:EF-P lysine aminoacylase EpmA [Microbulbifer thermotolerans]MCX2778270.1 EF-P lysine aminoacylase EpmA [Microbulbifer thermotolerans]MCX2804309.1 EF-P lysine aminoacylase EpmA [Microbulbifer thermotolerans]